MHSFFRSPLCKIFFQELPRIFWRIFPIIFFQLLAALLEGASFVFIFLAFSALDPHTSAMHFSSCFYLECWGLHFSPIQSFYCYLLVCILSQALRGTSNFISLYGTSLLAIKMQTMTQQKIYHQIFRFSFPFISRYKIGDLTEYAKSPSLFIPTLFTQLNQFLVSLFMCIGLLCVLYSISPPLTVWTFLLFALFSFLQKTLIRRVSTHSEKLTAHQVEFSQETLQSLQGIRPVHIFHQQNYVLKKIDQILERLVKSSRKVHFWNNLIPSINEIGNVFLVGGVMILGAFLLTRPGETPLPNLLTYIALTYRLATRMQAAITALSTTFFHYGYIARSNEILEENDKDYDPEGGETFSGWKDQILFHKVSLHYPCTKRPALTQVCFSIRKGTSTALVGLSGAGKSSLLDLLLNLQKPSLGEITIDGVSLQKFSHQSWRSRIGVVSQESFIFNGTIEENIRFGQLDAPRHQIEQAASLAEAAEFIENLPEGYRTAVGERGYRLSGGERQRLALARALLRDPDILILDEATSNLDSHSEELIQTSLQHIKRSKTLLIVAHRLSTIKETDQILVLEKGKIIETGTHMSLIKEKGRYAQLWALQSEFKGAV